jgi:hypothetical protein
LGQVLQSVLFSPLGCRLAVEALLVFSHANRLATDKVADGPPHAFARQLRKRGKSFFVPTLRVFAQKGALMALSHVTQGGIESTLFGHGTIAQKNLVRFLELRMILQKME